jgi:hypothetical protein
MSDFIEKYFKMSRRKIVVEPKNIFLDHLQKNIPQIS